MAVRRRQTGRRRAFTLLEVMLVLGIIAVLAIFIVPRLVGTGEAAKIKAAKTIVTTGLNGAIDRFYAVHGAYPKQLQDLIKKPDAESSEEGVKYRDLDLWKAYLLEGQLKDPWNGDYAYKLADAEEKQTGLDYRLFSKGPDQKEDTDDDLTNWIREKE